MKPSLLLPVLTASHLAVLGLSYQLGQVQPHEATSPNPTATTVLTPEMSRRPPNAKNRSEVLPSLEPHSFCHRLQSMVEQTASLDAGEVLSSLKQIRHLPSSVEKLLKEQALLARFAEIDPETALTYVARLGGMEHELGTQTVMSAWTAHDPEGASRYFEEQADDFGIFDENQRATVGAIAAEWAAQDQEAALNWADGLTPEVQGEAYRRIMTQAISQNPREALELLTSMPNGLERREMLETLADQWTIQDPHSATTWLASLDENDQVSALPKMVASWMQTDPMKASTWMASLDAGVAKDRGIVAMTQSTALQRDPEAAWAWSTVIQDPVTRARALDDVATRWHGVAP